jgi:hypothetical protein
MSSAAIVAMKVALIAFVVLLGVNPRWPLSRFMFRSRGPRSDVVCLTRRQLFAEGAKFLYLAVLGFVVMWAAVSIGDAMKVDLFGSPLAGGAFFIVAILFGMSILAGAYMLVRGLFRSPRYVPPPHCGRAWPSEARASGAGTIDRKLAP